MVIKAVTQLKKLLVCLMDACFCFKIFYLFVESSTLAITIKIRKNVQSHCDYCCPEQVGIASCLQCLQQELGEQHTSLLTACDNLGALNKVGSPR